MIRGQAKSVTIDQNGNLKVETEYTLTDGTKTIGYTRYNALNFTLAKLQEDIKSHCETLMFKIWNLKQNQELVTTDVTSVSYECVGAEIITQPEILDKDGNVVTPSVKVTIDDK